MSFGIMYITKLMQKNPSCIYDQNEPQYRSPTCVTDRVPPTNYFQHNTYLLPHLFTHLVPDRVIYKLQDPIYFVNGRLLNPLNPIYVVE